MLIKNLRISSLKDYKGISYINNFKCLVDGALPNDLLDVDVYKEVGNSYFARINKVVQPSNFRNLNIQCKYYKNCGACSLQHLNIDYYYDSKISYLRNLLNFNNIDLFKVDFFKRRRVNLKYYNGRYGFYNKSTTNLIEVESCLLLDKDINNIIKILNNNRIKITNLSSVDIFKVDNGIGINFIFSKDPNVNEFKKLDILKEFVILVNYTYENKRSFVPIIKKNDLYLNIKNFTIKLPNNFFMQATKESQDFIVDFVCNEIKDFNFVYDLYCGIGTYSFPLSIENRKVKCFEGDELMINSIKNNSLNLKNIFFEKRDLFNQPIVNFDKVDAIIINPPRNGSGNQCKYINKSGVAKIVYISCNPETFKSDLNLLNTYRISKIVLVDQFFYSTHIEIIAVLEKNNIN